MSECPHNLDAVEKYYFAHDGCLLCQAEEDRAAIRAYKKAHDFMSLHPPCQCVICLGHADAIKRAEGQS